MDIVAADAEAVYGTNGRHHRLVIHELCKMATSPLSVRQSKDEFSDDERDEDLVEENTGTAEESDAIEPRDGSNQDTTIDRQEGGDTESAAREEILADGQHHVDDDGNTSLLCWT